MMEISNNIDFKNHSHNYTNKYENKFNEDESSQQKIENKISIDLSEQAKNLHKIDLQLKQNKTIDKHKIELLARKVQNRQLDIQGSYDKRMQSAKVIADKLIDAMMV